MVAHIACNASKTPTRAHWSKHPINYTGKPLERVVGHFRRVLGHWGQMKQKRLRAFSQQPINTNEAIQINYTNTASPAKQL